MSLDNSQVGTGTTARLRFAFTRVFGNRSLRRLELALALFNGTEWGTWIAMLVYAYGQGGTTEAGLVAAALTIPAAVFAPIGATLGDRHRPGRVLLASYAAQAVALAFTAVALEADAHSVVVYLCIGIANTSLTVARPSMSALTPTLARTPEELTAVNVVSSWSESVSLLISPIVTGVLLAVSGPTLVFVVMAAAMVVATILVIPVPGAPPAGEMETEPVLSSLTRAFRVVRAERAARLLGLLLAADFVALGALDVMYPELAIGVLERDGSWAGYLNAAFGVGATLGVVLTAGLVGRARLMPPMLVGMAAYLASFVVLAAFPVIVTALVLLAVAGAGRVVLDVGARTLLQRVAPNDVLARVFGLLEAMYMVGLAVGSLAVTGLVAVGGAELALIGIGLLLPLAALPFGRSLLDIDRHATVPAVEIGLLRGLPLFAPLPPAAMEGVARSLERVDVGVDVDVIVQGDEGDRFYVVADGEIDVYRDGALIDTLVRGDGFGEIALLHRVPRTATCRARTRSILYSLSKVDFLTAVTGNAAVAAAAERMASERWPASVTT